VPNSIFLHVLNIQKKENTAMSQRAVFVEVSGATYPEVLHSMPNMDDCVSIVKDMEREPCEYDTCTVYAVWYEIGEGESDTDNFFPEEVLLDWYENNRLEEETEKRGYNAEVVQSETTVLGAADFAD